MDNLFVSKRSVNPEILLAIETIHTPVEQEVVQENMEQQEPLQSSEKTDAESYKVCDESKVKKGALEKTLLDSSNPEEKLKINSELKELTSLTQGRIFLQKKMPNSSVKSEVHFT
ncbi:hypothetical protein C0J52_25896 [Blattella germanica]|nr:hypothetical protein C0J52_25896 [Blattella germanica]